MCLLIETVFQVRYVAHGSLFMKSGHSLTGNSYSYMTHVRVIFCVDFLLLTTTFVDFIFRIPFPGHRIPMGQSLDVLWRIPAIYQLSQTQH